MGGEFETRWGKIVFYFLIILFVLMTKVVQQPQHHARRHVEASTDEVFGPGVTLSRGGLTTAPLRMPTYQLVLGVGEVADHEVSPRGLVGTHLARPAEALGLLERGLDVGNADVEDHVAVVAHASADAARDPDPVAGRVAVHEPVVRRLGDRLRETGALVSNSHPNRLP